MTSPSGEMNAPLPPLLNRTADCWTFFSHASLGSNLYFSLSNFFGGLLKSHMPSSALALVELKAMNKPKKIATKEDGVCDFMLSLTCGVVQRTGRLLFRGVRRSSPCKQ